MCRCRSAHAHCRHPRMFATRSCRLAGTTCPAACRAWAVARERRPPALAPSTHTHARVRIGLAYWPSTPSAGMAAGLRTPIVRAASARATLPGVRLSRSARSWAHAPHHSPAKIFQRVAAAFFCTRSPTNQKPMSCMHVPVFRGDLRLGGMGTQGAGRKGEDHGKDFHGARGAANVVSEVCTREQLPLPPCCGQKKGSSRGREAKLMISTCFDVTTHPKRH